MRLTEKSVRALPAPDPSGRQTLHWADEPKGFGVLCSGVSDAKSYVVQRRLKSNQLRRRVTIGPCSVLTLADATEKAKGVLAEFYQGRDPKGARWEKITLQQALDQYLAARKDLSPATVRSYRTNVRLYLAPWADQPMHTITTGMVQGLHRKIQASVESEANRGHGTANQAMVTLRALWNFVADMTPMPPNPTRVLKRQWYEVRRRTGMVKADDMPAFYAAVRDLENEVHRDLILLLLFTGMRSSEAASLAWEDVDFKASVIRVPGVRTKSGRELDLPMSDVVRDVLVARRAIGREKHVFVADSERGHVTNVRYALEVVAEACGVDVSPHDLRRTWMTVAESCDVSPFALKALVNHTLGSGVTEGYVQMSVERLREPAQRVADRLKELCGFESVAGDNVARFGTK